MGLSFVASATGSADSVNSVATSSALNVQAGDLLVVFVRWWDSSTSCAVGDGGSNSFSMESVREGAYEYVAKGHILAAAANSAATITATLGATERGLRIVVLQFRPDSGETVSVDQATVAATGSSTSPSSGSITTTGTDEVAVGYITATESVSSEQIGGVARDGLVSMGSATGHVFYRILTAAMTGAATASLAASGYWMDLISSYKSASSGGISGAGGISSGESLGSASIGARISAAGLPSAEALGAPSLSARIAASGIETALAMGSPAIRAQIAAQGIASGAAVGAPVVGARISAAGIASAEALGSPSLAARILAEGIASAEAFGLPVVGGIHGAGGIASALAFGAPALEARIAGQGIISAEAFGLPIVGQPRSPAAPFLIVLAAEDRELVLAAESRTIAIAKESRIVTLEAESRLVAAEA